jgi:Amj-like protein
VTEVLVGNVVIAAVLTFVTQAIQIGAYSARYAGIVTGRIATAISLFSLLVVASRLAALFMVPSLGVIADAATNAAVRGHLTTVGPAALQLFDTQMRVVVAAGSFGTLLGGLLLPMFLLMFVRGIGAFERLGSVPRALLRLFDPRVIGDLLRALKPQAFRFSDFPIDAVPRKLLIANTLLFAVYSVGVVAAYYASVIVLDARTTATGLSGLVNGIGTIAFSLFVDPTTAFIVDQTVRGERPRRDVQAMIFWLVISAFVGTVLAQLILYPSAQYIAAVAHFWVGLSSKH